MTLSDFILNASPQVVQEGLFQIKADYFNQNQFVPDSNRLKSNAVDNIKNHIDPASGTIINPDELKSFLASSCILHSIDGWHYLSNSIHALLSGDIAIAIHLAYYAELRAASSLLASEGIGVFDSKHLMINVNSDIHVYPLMKKDKCPTHSFVWEALNQWVISPKPSNILKYFKYLGIDFQSWTAFIPNASADIISSLFIKDWIKNWCIDIENFKSDRKSRNVFSYRPFFGRSYVLSTLFESVEMLNSFWKVLEPSESNRFSVLDKYLFSAFIEKIKTNNVSSIPKDQFLMNVFTNSGKTTDNSLIEIFNNNYSHTIIEKAKDRAMNENEMPNPLAIISRAILMLRIATGATSYLIESVNVTKDELKFYINKVGIDGGFWNRDEMPEDFCDLWTDIDNLINDFEELSFDQDLTLKKLNDNHYNISTYSQFNRAAVWGLGL
jgi:hypothetical protein